MSRNNSTIDNVEEIFDPVTNVILSTLYAILLTVGIGSNGFVVYMYCSKKISKTQINTCLLHLSLMNVGQHIGVIPFLSVDMNTLPSFERYTGSIICAMTHGLYGMFTFAMASVYCLTFMCVSRYLIIKKPLSGHFTIATTHKIMGACWVFGIVWSIPLLLLWKIDRRYGFCLHHWQIDERLGDTFEIFSFVIGLIIPTLVMTVTCALLVCELYRKSDKAVCVTKLKRRKRVVVLLVGLVVIFFICSIPYGVYWILVVGSYFLTFPGDVYKEIRIIRGVIVPSLLAGILNPLFYGVTGKHFRSGIKKTLSRRVRILRINGEFIMSSEMTSISTAAKKEQR